MSTSPSSYRRLPGRGISLTGYYRLYEGPDHLLLASETGYRESYKRFYYQDIQAVILGPSPARLIWNGLWGVLAVICATVWGGILMASTPLETGRLTSALITILLPATALLVNNLLGPSCTCHIQTAVQLELLPCLRRLRQAKRVLTRLRPHIESTQGLLSAESLASLAAAPVAGGPATPPVIAAPAPLHSEGQIHRLLAWLLLADLPGTVLALAGPRWMHVPGMLLFSATCIVAVIALVRQRGTDLPAGLRLVPWLTLASAGVHQSISVIYGVYLGTQGRPHAIFTLSPTEDPVLRSLAITSTTVSVVLGTFALWQLRRVGTPGPANAPAPNEPAPPPVGP
jgi:hypothetical protein